MRIRLTLAIAVTASAMIVPPARTLPLAPPQEAYAPPGSVLAYQSEGPLLDGRPMIIARNGDVTVGFDHFRVDRTEVARVSALLDSLRRGALRRLGAPDRYARRLSWRGGGRKDGVTLYPSSPTNRPSASVSALVRHLDRLTRRLIATRERGAATDRISLPLSGHVASYEVARLPGLQLRGVTSIDVNPPSGSYRPLAGAGDVNADGIPDLVIGSQSAYVPGKGHSGMAHVVFGRAAAGSLALGELFPGGFSIEAAQRAGCIPSEPGAVGCWPSGQKVGWAVSGAGDVNGDGLGDVVVGAPTTQVGDVLRAGAAYVIWGKRDGEPVRLDDLGDDGFALTGSTSREQVGLAVAGVGDVNGDGLADVAVSRSGWHRGRPSAYVVFGKRDAATISTGSLGDHGFEVHGAHGATSPEACCHTRNVVVAAAGDVDGDGLADIAVGAPGQSPRGRRRAGSVFVVHGGRGSDPVDVERLGSRGYRIDGARPGDWMGAEVAFAGDFNGDRVPDLVVGGPTESFEPPRQGTAWVAYGRRSGRAAIDLARLGAHGLPVRGPVGGDASLAGLGDANGDGLSDVAIGSPRYGPRCRPELGSAFVVFGRRGHAPISLERLDSSGFRLDASARFDDPARFVAGVGDVNGDGRADILAGTAAPSVRAGGGGIWNPRVVFTPGFRGTRRGGPPSPCFSASVVDANPQRRRARGDVEIRLVNGDARATRLTVEISDARRSFFAGHHVRVRRTGIYSMKVPLPAVARSRGLLRVEAHQLIPRRRCDRLRMALFEPCPARAARTFLRYST